MGRVPRAVRVGVEIGRALFRRQHRVEALGVEVAEVDVVAGAFQRRDGAVTDRRVQAVRAGMGEDEENPHASTKAGGTNAVIPGGFPS